MTIAKFDKQNLPEVVAAIDKALKSVSEQFGINLKVGNVSYERDGLSFKTSVNGSITANSEEAKEAIDAKNTQLSKIMGFEKNIVGVVFNANGSTFEVVGINLNKPKFPIATKDLKTGKSVSFTDAAKPAINKAMQ